MRQVLYCVVKISHGKRRFRRLIEQLNLKSKAERHFKVTTDSHYNQPVAPNILSQRLSPSAANVTWTADIPYIRTEEEWHYLATIIALYSGRISVWSMGTRLADQVGCQCPCHGSPAARTVQGATHHSDRVSQYCSDTYST